MQSEIKISVDSQSVSYWLDGQSSIPIRIGNILFATTSGPTLGHTQPQYLFLFTVFTDEELDALLDRSDMLSASPESSNTGTQTKIKGAKIYKVIDQQCRDPKLKQLS